ncbi:MAG: YncE family protein [Candidatus Micrarchaeota archaeon]|nr:YncE family protein [Candidatus Micrarchaeota archaeon]
MKANRIALAILTMAVFVLSSAIPVQAHSNPTALAYNPATNTLYVADGSSGSVSVVNWVTNTVTNIIIVGPSPSSIAINPSNTLAYVANGGTNTISVVSLATNTVVNTINNAYKPRAIAISPDGTLAYVTETGNDVVSVVNLASNSIVNSISLGYACSGMTIGGIAFLPSGAEALTVASCGNGSGSANAMLIDVASNTVTNTIALHSNDNPYGVSINPAGTIAYIAVAYNDGFDVINIPANHLYTNTNTGPWPQAIAFNPSGTLAYELASTLTSGAGNVEVINAATNSVINTIGVGTQSSGDTVPGSLAFTPDNLFGFATNFGDGSVSVVNVMSNSIVNTIFIPKGTISDAISINPQTPILQAGSSFTVTHSTSGGLQPYTYGWFLGNVVGGFDQLQFSLVAPFRMPTPPPPNTLPTPMLYYQNPGNTMTITPYIWNGVAFNAVQTANALAIVGGNESRLPAFLPNLFTVTSMLANTFTIRLPGGAIAPVQNPSSQLIYDLDTYSLVQTNTLNVNTVLNSNSPVIVNAIANGVVGLNVTLTNLGISGKYVSANTPPMGISVTGWSSSGGSAYLVHVFFTANSLPSAHNTIRLQMQGGGGFNPLLYNVTSISVFGPLPPAPGVEVQIYDSVNQPAPSNTANDLLLATYSYNGPTLIYNTTQPFFGDIPGTGNVVYYLGENDIPVNFVLTSNSSLSGNIPTNSVPYFTYNVPEITSVPTNVPNTYMLVNLTNQTMFGAMPVYSFVKSMSRSNPVFNLVYVNSSGTGIREMSSNVTLRGSGIGPINPMLISYYMATNVVAYNSIPFSTSNSYVFNSNILKVGPNLIKMQISDSVPRTKTVYAGGVIFPQLQPAQESITNSSIKVGGTTFITITMKGGQPPFTGYWSMFPPSVSSIQGNTFMLTLPTNQITLLVNVTSSNTILLTPTLGTNTTVGGGRNNSMLLYILNHDAYLQFPSFGGSSQPPLLMASGLANSTIYGLWSANSTVNNSDPGEQFSIKSNTTVTTTIPYSGSSTTGGAVSGGGGGGPGGGGSTSKPVVTKTGSGYNVTNIAKLDSFNFTLNGVIFNVTDNYINPNSTGITVNGNTYLLQLNDTVSLGGSAAKYYARLFSVLYVPIQHAVGILFYSNSTNSSPATSGSSRLVSLNGSIMFNGSANLSEHSPLYINFTSSGLLLQVRSGSSSNFSANIMITNVTNSSSLPVLAGKERLLALNISVAPPENVTLNLTVKYNCSIGSSYIAPYIVSNSIWEPINSFTVDSSACSMSFSLPADPVVALYSSQHANTTTIAATTASSLPSTTTIRQAPQRGSGHDIAYAAIAVVIILLVLIYAYSRRRK